MVKLPECRIESDGRGFSTKIFVGEQNLACLVKEITWHLGAGGEAQIEIVFSGSDFSFLGQGNILKFTAPFIQEARQLVEMALNSKSDLMNETKLRMYQFLACTFGIRDAITPPEDPTLRETRFRYLKETFGARPDVSAGVSEGIDGPLCPVCAFPLPCAQHPTE